MNLRQISKGLMKIAREYGLPAYRAYGIKGVLNLSSTLYSTRRRPLSVKTKPLYIQLEPTIRCNLMCKMCDLSLRNRGATDLTLEDFKRIVKQLSFLQRIILQGVGEPLLNPSFFEMVKYAASKGITVDTFTNNALTTEETAKKIASSGLEKLWVSMDGATKETYENIREGASFEKTKRGIGLILKAKGDNERPKVGLWFVGMKSNIHELPQLIELAAELGVQTVHVEAAIDWGKEAVRAKLDSDNLWLDDISMSNSVKYFAAAAAKARENKIALEISPELAAACSHSTVKKQSMLCRAPWWTCYVTVEGYVTPCCVRPDPRLFNFGNVFEKNLGDIWNGPEYKEFRARVRSGKPPDICKGCWLVSGKDIYEG